MKWSQLREGWRGGLNRRTTQLAFSLLFTQMYDYQHKQFFFSVSVSASSSSSPLYFSLLLVLSTSVHDLAGAAKARLNCAISYMFTLLASFWAYFSPPLILFLHFLYNNVMSLISLCKPFLGQKIKKAIMISNYFFLSFFPSSQIWPRNAPHCN